MLIVSPGCERRFTPDLKNLDVMDGGTKHNHKLLAASLCRNKKHMLTSVRHFLEISYGKLFQNSVNHK